MQLLSLFLQINVHIFQSLLIVFAWLYCWNRYLGFWPADLITGWAAKRYGIDRCRKPLRDSWPLILSGLPQIYMRIDQVMVGNMLGNSVGSIPFPVKIAEVWYLFDGHRIFDFSIYFRSQEEKIAYTGENSIPHIISIIISYMFSAILIFKEYYFYAL